MDNGKRTATLLQRIWRCTLAFAAACGASFFFSIEEPTLLSAAVFGVMMWLQFCRSEPIQRRVRIVSACVAAFYAISSLLYRYPALGMGAGFFSLRSAFLLFGMWAMFYVPFCSVYQRWCGVSGDLLQPSGAQLKRLYWIAFAAMLLLWLPMYLMYFPGRVCYDSTEQMNEFLHHIPRNHHPFLHSMLMKAILCTGAALFGSPNGGVALYCVLQMLCFALLFSYVIVTMRAFGAKRWFCVMTLLFFALEPNVMYRSQVLEKDGTFSMMVMLFLVTLWRLIVYTRRGEPVSAHVRDVVLLGIGALGFCTMRTNGFFTFVPMTLLLLFVLNKKLRIVKAVCAAACALTLTYLLLIPALGIINPDPIEALSLPLQHIGRVLHDGGDVTDEEMELLNHIMDTDSVEECYTPYTSDTLKTLVRATGDQAYLRAHAIEYFKLWLHIGLRNPRLYLYAQIDETCGYWTPQYLSPRAHYHTEGDMKDYLVDNPWGYYADPVLPDAGIRVVQNWMIGAQKIPLVGMLRNIGTVTWLAVAALGATILRRQRFGLLLHAPFVVLFAILMVTTPYNVEYRYLYPLLIALPLIYAVTLYGEGVPAPDRSAATNAETGSDEKR